MFLKLLTRKMANAYILCEKKSRVGALEARQQRRSERRHKEELNIEREEDTCSRRILRDLITSEKLSLIFSKSVSQPDHVPFGKYQCKGFMESTYMYKPYIFRIFDNFFMQ